MHIEIAIRPPTRLAALQLQAYFVPDVSIGKNLDTNRATVSLRGGMFPQPLETWEAYETVMDRLASGTGNVARISPADLASAQANAGGG